LVIEVLSPTTQSIDLREKALSYKRLQSVEEYVIAAQTECRVTVYRRAEGWEPHTYAGYDALLELRSVGLKLALDEIYRTALSDA
jgi:Uma2 family endonuclease